MRDERLKVFTALAEGRRADRRVVVAARPRRARAPAGVAVAHAFVRHADAHAGRVRGNVSAAEPSDSERKSVEVVDRPAIKIEHVTLDFAVDASLVGGVVVKVGDLIWDGSVRRPTKRMRQALR